MKDEEDIRSILFGLSAKREEHFQVLDGLLNKSEQRIDKTQTMIQTLIEVMADTKKDRDEIRAGFEKRIAELQKIIDTMTAEKAACIGRYEKKLAAAEARADTVQRQNDELITHMNWLDGQIAKLEDHILHTTSAPQTGPGTQINVNGMPSIGG